MLMIIILLVMELHIVIPILVPLEGGEADLVVMAVLMMLELESAEDVVVVDMAGMEEMYII